MGGFGSGRYGGSPTSEGTASYGILLSSFRIALRTGQRMGGTITFSEGDFPVQVTIDISDASNAFLDLVHRTRDTREGPRMVTDRVRLVWTEPTYGGRRWWFICPRTGRRATRLFLPNGGWHFWSRQAYGLGYACQREDRFSRLQRRAAMLNKDLGGRGWATWNEPPQKPKWMRWRTYDDKYQRWERVVEQADAQFTIRAETFLSRLRR